MSDFLKIAELNEEAVAQIRALEKSMGTHIMAYQPGLALSDLTDDQLHEVKALEKELGVILISYDE